MSIALPRTLRRFATNIPLRWVLTVPFVLPTIGATVLVGYLSYQSGQRAITDLANQLMQEKGDQITFYLERTLEVPHLVNQLNADSIRLGQLPGLETQDPAPLEKSLWAQLLRFPDVTSIAFANERGGMVGSGRLYQPESIAMSVYRTPQFAKGIYSLSTTDAQGNLLETKTVAQNYDARTRPWYQTPAQAGKATWSPIYQYVSHLETLGISAGLPIYAPSGKLQGILTADINLKKLNEFLSNLHVSESGQVFIIERSGLLVSSSTNQPLLTTQAGKGERLKASESRNPTTRETMTQLTNYFGNLTNIEATQQFTIKPSMTPKWVRVIPFKDQYGLDWLIVVVIPKSDFLGTIHANRGTAVLLSLLTLGGAVGLGLLTANRLTARFTELNRISRELASGNLDQRLLTNGLIYELNGLAQTFNQMADQLQQSFDRIKTALAESEEKFTIIFHSSPDPITLAVMPEGRYVEANDSFVNLLEYSRQELIGQRFVDLGIWIDLEERAYFHQVLLQQGHVRNLEARFRTRTGQTKIVLLSAELIEINGETYALGIIKDISERKATELALQQSETRYRAIVEDQTELIARFLPDTTLLFVNEAYCRYFGLDREDVIGKSYQPVIYTADRDRVAYLMQSTSIDHPTVTIENRVIVNGSIRWMQWVNRMLFDPQGNFTEFQSVGRDITQLKQTEEALRKSEATLLQAQRIARVGSWEFDLATQNLTWSEELFRISGLDPAQSQPSYAELVAMIPAEDWDILSTAMNQSIADGSFYEVEHRLCRPDGTIAHVISKGQVVFDGQQQVFKLYGTVLDITERKRAEAEIQQLNQQLTHRVSELQTLFDVLPIGVAIGEDPECRMVRINPRLSELLRVPLNANASPNAPDPDRPAYRVYKNGEEVPVENLPMQYAAIHNVAVKDEEFDIVHPDGTVLQLFCCASPLRDEQGKVRGVLGGFVDLTERKQAEVALQASEARFQEIAQTINQVFYVISVPTGQYLYISSAYEKLWGYSCESLYQDPKSWLDRIHPEDLEKVLAGLNDLFAGIYRRLQYRIFAATGEVRWIESESLIVYDDNKDPLRIVGLADDITDRKRLEQSLQSQAEEERLLATISQHIRQSLDLEQILATTVVEVQRTLKADRVLIFQLHQDGSGQVIQEAVLPEYSATNQMCWLDECFPEECYAFYLQGNPRIVPDVALDDWASCLAEFMQEAGIKSKVVAPIVQACGESAAKVWGLLIVHACSDYRQWQNSEADFLQQICNQLAIAIDQANLYWQLQTELAERRQTEQALQEREAMLRAIGDNLPKGFIYQRVHDPDQGFYYSYISAGIERLLGVKPEAVLQDPKVIREVGFEEELAAADLMVQESLKQLTPIELQMRHRTAQGDIEWSSIRSIPRRLADGRTVWDGVEVDITDLKRIEAALRTSEEQFRRAFDNAPIGISLVSLTGRFIKVNSYYCDLLGYTEAELLALTFQEITHPADIKADLEGFQRMIVGEIRAFQMEKRYINKQGTVIPVLMNAALVPDHDGQPLYCVGQVQDIRDRLKVERMKDEFISVVSHELRTPLTSIRGALGILGSGIFDNRPEKAKHMLQIAMDNSVRLVRLVDDILSLERLESGKVQLVMEHCQTVDLMQQAINSVQAIADQSNITLSLTPLSVTLWAAPDAVIQTLTNLLSNAIKFSAPGDTVWLKAELGNGEWQIEGESLSDISTSESSLQDHWILFSITDQGRGIPEDKLTIIFERFQQVDGSDSRKKGGTGLGLAICKNIVQQHGGHIWAESGLGQGSTFYVALPLATKDRDNSERNPANN
jgi:PAS domain S-box-containing protein